MGSIFPILLANVQLLWLSWALFKLGESGFLVVDDEVYQDTHCLPACLALVALCERLLGLESQRLGVQS